MDLRKITDSYYVAPQIDPVDMDAIRDAGITCIIANRPDEEVPASHAQDVMEAAAHAAGLAFVRLPITHQTMTPERVAAQRDAHEDAEGAVLAYCASGTRSTIIWALGQAQSGAMEIDAIMAAAAAGGYDLTNLRETLVSLAP